MRALWPEPVDDLDVDAAVAAEHRLAPPGRPWVLVNMIVSLDGATAIGGQSGPLGGPADKAVFGALRAVADVIVAGAGTVRAEGYGPPRPTEERRAARGARGQAPVPRLAVVTASLELDLDGPLFTDAEVPPYLLTCEAAPADRVRAARKRAEVVVAGDRWVEPEPALAALAEGGAATVLAEGGPHLNGWLVAADVVDEWCLTVSPLLVAGESNRPAVGPPVPDPARVRVDRIWEGDGLLFLRHVRA